MRCKALQVKVDFELQAVTCPGVWLCPSGCISAQIFMLNTCTRTSLLEPIFPMLCHENFEFKKTFYNIKNLKEIDDYLGTEELYIELVQWRNKEVGNVLAFFRTSVLELLYPPAWSKGVVVGVDVDLLMEATNRFPGIIAPKLEVSTKTTIEEILCKVPKEQIESRMCNCFPQTAAKRSIPIRQKRVCHSYNYHKARLKQDEKYDSDAESTNTRLKTTTDSQRPKTAADNKRRIYSDLDDSDGYSGYSGYNQVDPYVHQLESRPRKESILRKQSSNYNPHGYNNMCIICERYNEFLKKEFSFNKDLMEKDTSTTSLNDRKITAASQYDQDEETSTTSLKRFEQYQKRASFKEYLSSETITNVEEEPQLYASKNQHKSQTSKNEKRRSGSPKYKKRPPSPDKNHGSASSKPSNFRKSREKQLFEPNIRRLNRSPSASNQMKRPKSRHTDRSQYKGENKSDIDVLSKRPGTPKYPPETNVYVGSEFLRHKIGPGFNRRECKDSPLSHYSFTRKQMSPCLCRNKVHN